MACVAKPSASSGKSFLITLSLRVGSIRGLLASCGTCCLLWILSLQSIRAELVWDSNEIVLNPSIDAKSVSADFHFANRGKSPVIIEKITPACGCTTAVLSKQIYEAGESGAIHASFQVGNREGRQEKSISVVVAGTSKPVDLRLIVQLAISLKIQPTHVDWVKGTELRSQNIEVISGSPQPIFISKVYANYPDLISVKIIEIQKGYCYHLVLTPSITSTPSLILISVEGGLVGGVKRLFKVYAWIREGSLKTDSPQT